MPKPSMAIANPHHTRVSRLLQCECAPTTSSRGIRCPETCLLKYVARRKLCRIPYHFSTILTLFQLVDDSDIELEGTSIGWRYNNSTCPRYYVIRTNTTLRTVNVTFMGNFRWHFLEGCHRTVASLI